MKSLEQVRKEMGKERLATINHLIYVLAYSDLRENELIRDACFWYLYHQTEELEMIWKLKED